MTNDHDQSCPGCQSRRVVIGKFRTKESIAPTCFRCFRPDGFWSTVAYHLSPRRKILIPLDQASFLCLGCGMIWTMVDLKMAEAQIRDRVKLPLKQSLGLVEKTHSVDDEFA